MTVRNRARNRAGRRILPPVPIHNLESVQDMSPVQSVPSAQPAGSRELARQQAGPPWFWERAGLRSSVRSNNNNVISGDTAGSREQKEVESCELVLRAASEMANLGILRVLRSSPRAEASADSVLVQSSGGPGQSGSRELGSEGGRPAGAAGAAGGDTPGRGGLRRLGSQDRLDTRQPLLSGSLPVQADRVLVEPEQNSDQAAEVALPTVRCGSRVKTSLLRRLQEQTLPDKAPPMGKIHPFSKLFNQ